jgi:RIO-like serine/threonine protein kinase
MATRQVLKQGDFGSVALLTNDAEPVVVRDTDSARWWLRGIARRLAQREAAALERLAGQSSVPTLIAFDGTRLMRSYLAGRVMHVAQPSTRYYFRAALRLLIRMHRGGVAHNDLAKEANWLELDDGSPGIVDFQIASVSAHRGKLFRMLAREDLRHLLKHKQRYVPDCVTARQRAMLRTPSVLTRGWRAIVKPIYRLATRGILGWPERRGPVER